MAKQRLSVCMIVKNEEKFLEECLRSVQPVADQIVVLDTGSEDRTVEIARKYGAEVHSFVWKNDFAAARNASIKYAKGDWILWLDADERLLPESVPLVKKLLRPERKAVAYLVTIKNVLADGKTFKLSTGHRLFTNRKNIYFEGRVHEQIIFSVARAGGEERPSPVTLLHLGYGLSQEIQDKKNERNRQLLLKMIEENPADAYAHFTLGQNYNLSHEYEKALEHYLIALEKNRFQKSLKTQLLNTISEAYFKLKQYDRALEFAERSLALNSAQIGAYYLQYRIAEARGEWNNALQWLEKLREKNKQVAQGTLHTENDILLSDLDIAITQANLLYRANRVEEARNVLKELLRFPVELSTLKRIVRFLLDRGEEEMARTALLENEAHLDSELLDALGLIQIKQQNFLQAIQTYTRLLGLQPDNLQIVKRLAGLFLKIGEREMAEQLLKMLNELNVMQPKAPASV